MTPTIRRCVVRHLSGGDCLLGVIFSGEESTLMVWEPYANSGVWIVRSLKGWPELTPQEIATNHEWRAWVEGEENRSGQWCLLHNCDQDDPSHVYEYPKCEPHLMNYSAMAQTIAAQAAENTRLLKAIADDRPNGRWLDQWGGCRVCGGEIPHGHTESCDHYKLECAITSLTAQLAAATKRVEELESYGRWLYQCAIDTAPQSEMARATNDFSAIPGIVKKRVEDLEQAVKILLTCSLPNDCSGRNMVEEARRLAKVN